MSEEKSFSIEDFSIGLVGGLIAGTLLGVIFAPSSGQKTRHKIQDWATDTKSTAQELIDKSKKPIDSILQKTQAALGLQEKGLRKKLEQIKDEIEHFDLSNG